MTIEPARRYQLADKVKLVFDSNRKAPMLLYPERGLSLNEVAAAIARACGQPVTVAEIARILRERFPEASPQTIEQDVIAFLQELERRGLLQSVG
ncbi:MAG: pyrroloquinoline quinone biosynthesis peptide chaperone PqqD [Myxococcales bacterium]|nr:pyrroloquinoline quinone biosynthesis peptide chaperone PqqD [Myxococcales bacterium]MDD9971435.1 pyrroloquinoline quinone biosynthesis peptide chaperone PqqD [Myxococcales bacterium]